MLSPTLVASSTKLDPSDQTKTVPDNRLTVIDLKESPPAVLATLTAGSGASGVAINRAGTLALVANRNQGTVSVFTIAGKTVTAAGTVEVGTPDSLLSGIAFTRDGRRALVVNAGESAVAVFERMSRARIANIPVAGYPLGIAVDPNGRFAYVGSTRDDEISVIDLETNTVSGRIPVPPLPTGMLWVDTP